mgnify:FL=1|jgi:hypothetical protein|tara:strand:+ start:547 stop:1272 length:726 start_codon:yes stop_codon:yes gene_type:complete
MNKSFSISNILLVSMLLFLTPSFANDIYITQSGDGLDLDITQDGANNVIGTSGTDVTLAGDDMTFAITQTGSSNSIAAIIKGDTYTGTWQFTGDSNTVDLLCSSSATGNCDTVTLNITTTGDDNTYDFDIGETADADSSTVTFTVTGDNNIVNTDVDGQSASLAVTVNNSSSLSTNSDNSDEGVAITTTQSGNGDSQGMGITLNVTGGGGKVDITQSGVNDNIVDLTIAGDDFDVDISQTD